MTWSDVQFGAGAASLAAATPTLPSAWQPEELYALGGEIFVAPSADPAASLAEAAEIAAADADRRVREAYQNGFNAGQTAGIAASHERTSSAVMMLHAAARLVAATEATVLNVLEDNLSALAVCVARQIVAREVRTSPEITIDLVRLAVTEFPQDQPLRIRINPLDLSTLSTTPGGEAVRIAPDREINWVADARIIPGGCVVEGRERIIDGRVDTALERTYRALSSSAAS
jgi:flagellar assembly protein FliH